MSAGLSMMPWYPSAHLGSTLGWPLIADGAYRKFLDTEWLLGSLPASEPELRALLGSVTAAEWRTIWRCIESKFPLNSDGRRRNSRLEQYRSDSLRRRDANQRGAKMTNDKRGAQRPHSDPHSDPHSATLSDPHSDPHSGSPLDSDSDSALDPPSNRSHKSGMPAKAPATSGKNAFHPESDRAEALQIAAQANVDCDPEVVVGKFVAWLAGHPSKNWRKALPTFTRREHFSERQAAARKAQERAGGPVPIASVGQLAKKFCEGNGS